MEEENLEDFRETSENTEEENLNSKKQETDEQKADAEAEAKNRQLYERTKKAEQKAKEEEAKRMLLEKDIKIASEKATREIPNASKLAKTVATLKNYNADEIDYIFKQAEFLKIDPVEAANSSDVQLFLKAKREQIERSEKIPEPSTKQTPTTKNYNQWTNEDLSEATQRGDWDAVDGFRKWMREQ